jgi:hypothetical protein
MTFTEWSAAIVAGVRTYLPDARAVRKGPLLVVIRHGDREAYLKQDGPAWSFWVTFPAGEMKTTMASLVDASARTSSRSKIWRTASRVVSTRDSPASKFGESETCEDVSCLRCAGKWRE